MPVVSIILTSRNHEKFIRAAIESVLSQTFEDFELIIWDDASSDASWEIISSYSDARIRAFRNEAPLRAIFGVNKGISEIASGKYIAMHHSDDVWENHKLQTQVDFLDEHPEYGAVFSNALAIDEQGCPHADQNHFYARIFDQENRSRHEWLNRFFYQGNALCHPSVLVRRECYANCGTYRYGLGQLGDLDMWIRLCLKYEIHVLPEKLVQFRVRDNEANTSGNRLESRIRTQIEHYNLMKNFLSIDSFEDIALIFPDARKYYRPGGFVPKFVLAMMAMDRKSAPWIKMLGTEVLFELIGDRGKAEEIERLYDFNYMDLISLTGKNDIFSFDNYSELKTCRDQLERVNRHIVSGPVIKLLRFLKRDSGFGG